jgi:hypothetical protein
MIDDLQGRAECIVGRPHRAALAVNVADETADRHRRKGAIGHQVVPIAVTQLGYVKAKRGQQILRVLGREPARVQSPAQPYRRRVVIIGASETTIQPIEQCELLRRRQRGMVGDIVGGADEIVECEDRLAMARVNEKGRHREVFIPVSLART